MADAIGVTASLIAIATFVFQTSKEVYNLVDSIQNRARPIEDLKGELFALDPILSSLWTMIESDASKFEDLRYPLHQCGMVCFHLRHIIRKCTEHSANGTRSLRDWATLQYKGKTINAYKGQLTSYKATIEIALQIYTLSNSALTAKAVDELKTTLCAEIGSTQLALGKQIVVIKENLNTVAGEQDALFTSSDGHTNETTSVKTLEDKEKDLEDDKLALEAEKKALEQSHHICLEAQQRLESPHARPSSQIISVSFSGANNSGMQMGQNTGTIGSLTWGAKS